MGGSAKIPGGQFDPPPPHSITKQRPGKDTSAAVRAVPPPPFPLRVKKVAPHWPLWSRDPPDAQTCRPPRPPSVLVGWGRRMCGALRSPLAGNAAGEGLTETETVGGCCSGCAACGGGGGGLEQSPSRGPVPSDAFEGKGPQRRPQKQLDRRLVEVSEAVGDGNCRLHMPLKLAVALRAGGQWLCVGWAP